MKPPLDAFEASRTYAGRSLKEHFGETLYKSDSDLARESASFLKLMATWVYRKLRERRGKVVPLGEFSRFVYDDSVEINLFERLMTQIVVILRKRGLREWDSKNSSPTSKALVRAYEATASRR